MFYNKSPLTKHFLTVVSMVLSSLLWVSTTSAEEAFDAIHVPPTLSNPTKIVLSRASTTSNVIQYGACGPGKFYRLSFADDEDALITFDDTKPLPYPVHIFGGKNIIIKGLEIELVTQPGNEVGAITQTSQQYSTTNPHPAVPACGGLRLKPSSNTTHWVEGLYLDTKGHNADGIIVNGPETPATSKVVIQNSLIKGIEGSMDLHGDILQTQSGHLGTLIFENVTMRQALEGVVLSYPVDKVVMRNIDYDTDLRYDSDDEWDDIISGGFFAGADIQTYDLDNIYIKYKNPNTERWFQIKDKHFSSPETAGTVVYGVTTEAHPEVHFKQRPPQGDFALASQVGKNYQVPAPVPDDGAPSAPSNLNTSHITQTSLKLSWDASTDNVGVKEYDVSYNEFDSDAILLKTTTETSITLINLKSGVNYTLRVQAKDQAGNRSIASDPETVVTESAPIDTDETTDTPSPEDTIEDDSSAGSFPISLLLLGFWALFRRK
jgi:hypothetical protein